MQYTLYNDDRAVASFEVRQGLVTDFVPVRGDLLPMQLRSASPEGFMLWLSARSIDLNVVRHRQLMHALTGSRDKLSVAIATHMVSLSDTFTCFPSGEFEPRSALCSPQEQEEISQFILISGDTTLRRTGIATPNASTDGSFAKTWKFENGAWWLYKLQPPQATQSESEISLVLREAGFDAAEYEPADDADSAIRTKCFVGEHEFFEPYDSLRFLFSDKCDADDVILQNLSSLGEAFAERWKDILTADALFQNTDRHTRNFGVIRSSETGQILRLAPNFDNNQAYKANPGGHYSDTMLRRLCRSDAWDESDRKRLERLVSAAGNHPYLREAAEAGAKVLAETAKC